MVASHSGMVMYSTSRSKISNDGSEDSMGFIVSKSQAFPCCAPDALCRKNSKLWSTPPVVLNNFNADCCVIQASLLRFWPLESSRSASTSYTVMCGHLLRATENLVSSLVKQNSRTYLEQRLTNIWAANSSN